MAKLTVSGVCDSVVFKWVLLWLGKEHIRLKDIDKDGDRVEMFFDSDDDAYSTYQRLKEHTQNAEADYHLELMSWED